MEKVRNVFRDVDTTEFVIVTIPTVTPFFYLFLKIINLY